MTGFYKLIGNNAIKLKGELMPEPSKLEEVVDPCSGPRGPLPQFPFSRDTTGVKFLNLNRKIPS